MRRLCKWRGRTRQVGGPGAAVVALFGEESGGPEGWLGEAGEVGRLKRRSGVRGRSEMGGTKPDERRKFAPHCDGRGRQRPHCRVPQARRLRRLRRTRARISLAEEGCPRRRPRSCFPAQPLAKLRTMTPRQDNAGAFSEARPAGVDDPPRWTRAGGLVMASDTGCRWCSSTTCSATSQHRTLPGTRHGRRERLGVTHYAICW